MPKKTRVASNPEYECTKAVDMVITPKRMTITARNIFPKCFKAKLQGISVKMNCRGDQVTCE